MTELVPLKSNHIVLDDQGHGVLMTPENTPFEFTTEWINSFQNPDGTWLEEGWPTVEAISICETETCLAYNQQVKIILAVNVDGIFRNECGLCNNKPKLYEVP